MNVIKKENQQYHPGIKNSNQNGKKTMNKNLIVSRYQEGNLVRCQLYCGISFTGIIIYFGLYRIKLLTSGSEVKKDFSNMLSILYDDIKKIDFLDHGKFSLGEELEVRKNPRKQWNNVKRRFLKINSPTVFRNSYVFEIKNGCELFIPTGCKPVVVSVKVYVKNGTDWQIFIPTSIKQAGSNENHYTTYNYWDHAEGPPRLYLYLPKRSYEDLNIVCVWSVRMEDNKDDADLNIVQIEHIGQIKPVLTGNVYSLEVTTVPYYGWGGHSFIPHKGAGVFKYIMDYDNYFIVKKDGTDTSFVKLKGNENWNRYEKIVDEILKCAGETGYAEVLTHNARL